MRRAPLLLGLLLAAPRALACPTCGAAQEGSSSFWMLLAAFLATPPLIALVAAWVLRRRLAR